MSDHTGAGVEGRLVQRQPCVMPVYVWPGGPNQLFFPIASGGVMQLEMQRMRQGFMLFISGWREPDGTYTPNVRPTKRAGDVVNVYAEHVLPDYLDVVPRQEECRFTIWQSEIRCWGHAAVFRYWQPRPWAVEHAPPAWLDPHFHRRLVAHDALYVSAEALSRY